MKLFTVIKNAIFGTTPSQNVSVLPDPLSDPSAENRLTPALGSDRIIDTVAASNDYQLRLAREHSDVISSMQFCATMQLRTPARVLRQHGAIHADLNQPLPAIAEELWEGIWLHKTRTYKELGLDVPEFMSGHTMASDVGPIAVDGDDYLAFLLAVRTAVETNEPTEVRADKLHALLLQPEYDKFVTAHRGAKRIVDQFFPLFVDTIPKLTGAAAARLTQKGLTTANTISAASDSELLAISGIGPAKLEVIRKYCAELTMDRDAVRLDYTIR